MGARRRIDKDLVVLGLRSQDGWANERRWVHEAAVGRSEGLDA